MVAKAVQADRNMPGGHYVSDTVAFQSKVVEVEKMLTWKNLLKVSTNFGFSFKVVLLLIKGYVYFYRSSVGLVVSDQSVTLAKWNLARNHYLIFAFLFLS